MAIKDVCSRFSGCNIMKDGTKRNVVLYIIGIMMFKFSVEPVAHYFNQLVKSSFTAKNGSDPDVAWAVTLSVYNIFQCFGSLTATSLIFRYRINRVLAGTLLLFSFLVLFFPIMSFMKKSDTATKENSGGKAYYSCHIEGVCNGWMYATVYCLSGITYGMIEVIRRVIPQSIVGSDEEMLKRMDANVHIFYEVSGVLSAFLHFIFGQLNYNTNFVLLHFVFTSTVSTFCWNAIKLRQDVSGILKKESAPDFEPVLDSLCSETENQAQCPNKTPESQDKNPEQASVAAAQAAEQPEVQEQQPQQQLDDHDGKVEKKAKSSSILQDMVSVFRAFGHSVVDGSILVCRNRALVWLIPAYSLPLVIHRYFENVLLDNYARLYYNEPDYRLLFQSGSNLGELLGALFILCFSKLTSSPIPWIRVDALLLFFAWFLVINTNGMNVPVAAAGETWSNAEKLKELFLANWPHSIGVIVLCACISLGFAAGDVSLAAYIQARLSRSNIRNPRSSPLGSVMAFLYVCYILTFALVSIPISLLKKKSLTGGEAAAVRDRQRQMLYYECAAFTIAGIFVFLSTFVPRKSFAVNPDLSSDSDPLYYFGCKRNMPKLNDNIALKPISTQPANPRTSQASSAAKSAKEAAPLEPFVASPSSSSAPSSLSNSRSSAVSTGSASAPEAAAEESAGVTAE